jgi:replicative DNA helicase
MHGTASAVIERRLPHNLEAERAVLGAIMIENSALYVAATRLTPADFFRAAHRELFALFLKMAEGHQEIDLVTVHNHLAAQGRLDEIGGPAYVASLVDGVPRSSNIDHYADIVREKSALRQIIMVGNRAIGLAYEGDQSAEDVLQAIEEALFEVRGRRAGELIAVCEGIAELYRDLEWLDQHPGELTGISTGHENLDQITHGLQRGDMIIVAARPSVGKTALALEWAKSIGQAGKGRVAFFSLEMRRKQLERRLLANISGVDLARILKGGTALGAMDWKAIAQAQEIIAELPIWIDDTATRTVWDIRAACRRLQSGPGGLAAVIVDYIQLMGAEGQRRRGENRTQELSDVSRRLKVLAGELHVPMVVLSQLVRLETNERPRMHHLRESGSLEQDADIVALLYAPKGHQASGLREVIIDKQRNGPTGVVYLNMERETGRFVEVVPDPVKEAPVEGAKPRRRRSPARW